MSRRCPASPPSGCSRRWPAASRWSRRPGTTARACSRRLDSCWRRDGDEMARAPRAACSTTPTLRRGLAATGLHAILARHTCAHRVDELLAIHDRRSRGPAERRSYEHARESPSSAPAWSPATGTAPPPTTAGCCAPWPRAAMDHLLRARRLRPAAAPRHRRPGLGRVVVCPATPDGLTAHSQAGRRADLIVKASGVGVFDARARGRRPGRCAGRATWSPSGTSTRRPRWTASSGDRADPFRAADPALRPGLHLRRRRPGGRAPTGGWARGSASRSTTRSTPTTHHPVAPEPRFAGRLGFLGNRLPDREARVEEFFLARRARACRGAASCSAAPAGASKPLPANVRYLGHVGTRRPQRLQLLGRGRSSTSTAPAWPRYGFSPADPRVRGGRRRRLPDHRRLGGHRAVPGARPRDPGGARRRGGGAPRGGRSNPARARRSARRRAARVLAEHTYAHRAAEVEARAATGRRAGGGCRMKLVVLGLVITSSWGNGHATTYRGLLRALARARPRGAVPRARRALVRGAPRPAEPGLLHRRASTQGSPSCEARFAGVVAEADAVILGSYVPDGVAVGDWLCARPPTGVKAFYDIDTPVTLAKLAPRRARVPRARADPALRSLPFVHRRPDPRPARAAVRRPLGPCRSTARSTSVHYRPSSRAAALGPGLPRHLQRRPAAASSSGCCWSRPGSSGSAASSSPARSIRRPCAGPPTSSGMSTCRRRVTAAFYAAQRFTLTSRAADMVAAGWSPSVRLFEAAACGVPIISDAWPGLDELFRPDAEILLARNAEDVRAHHPRHARAAAPRHRARRARARADAHSCARARRRARTVPARSGEHSGPARVGPPADQQRSKPSWAGTAGRRRW